MSDERTNSLADEEILTGVADENVGRAVSDTEGDDVDGGDTDGGDTDGTDTQDTDTDGTDV
jgi:hypothetical protein